MKKQLIAGFTALVLLGALSACGKRNTYTAVKLTEANAPPHTMANAKRAKPRKGKAPLDKHLREEAENLRRAGDTADTLDELQAFERDRVATQPPSDK